jgi:plasmid stabilization system protein ParE
VTFKVVIRRDAKSDIDDAHSWYEEQQSGLGSEFLDAVALALTRIAEGPLRFPISEGDARRALVRRFPYSIYFRVRGEDLRVIAVAHQQRNPKLIKRRLGR